MFAVKDLSSNPKVLVEERGGVVEERGRERKEEREGGGVDIGRVFQGWIEQWIAASIVAGPAWLRARATGGPAGTMSWPVEADGDEDGDVCRIPRQGTAPSSPGAWWLLSIQPNISPWR